MDTLSQSIKFEKIMNQAISVKQTYTSTPWRDMTGHDTTVTSGYGDVRVFSEIAKVFPEFTRITKAEGFLRCKKKNLNGRDVIM